ncbi:ABC transporter substrate-binding protein [Candidatus Poribacteria bacterium]|nr:ABC transporter substrate-binding protein [Candidatus Poribacteria bacterium]MYG05238.1 ABC transporter substrate-binding protein [Candidatus Poribacteria bacterium]MYK22157.1 ABC transporter substrate-binding protein [Candidatus Poribacteria bacterium]
MSMRIFILISVILLTALTGCERVNQVVQPDATTTPTEAILKIGVIQPSNTFTTFSQGAETARAQINEKGGLLGMQVEFISRNNQPIASEPPTREASVTAAKELIEMEDVFALLGPVYSSNSVEVGPIAQQAQRLMLPGSSGSNVPESGDYVFLMTVPNPFQGKVMAGFAMNPNELGAKTAATIIEEGDNYTIDLVAAFEAAFQANGGEIVYSGAYSVGETNFTALLTEIHEATPDVIFCPGFQPEVPSLIKEARQIGITATFLGGSAWDDRERFLSILDDNTILDGSYYPTNFSVATQDADVQEFVSGYTTLFGSPPDGIAASGYDAMRLLARAIETAGSLDPDAVRDAFAAVSGYKGATTISHYDANRHPVKSLTIQTIRGGQVEHYKVVEP